MAAEHDIRPIVRAARVVSEFRRLLPRREDLDAVRRHPRQDLVAGLTVAMVALPLALAFGAASGLGAQAGLATAVVAGIIAAVLGGSNLQVSGPTGAMTVVLVPVVHQFGPSAVLMVGLMAGLILVMLAFARLGRYVRFLPVPVLEGFTAGIAVVIALQQVPAALGVTDATGDRVWQIAIDAVGRFSADPHLAAPVTAFAVAGTMLLGSRWWPGVPFSIVGIAVATLVAGTVETGLVPLGHLPAGLPSPSLGFVDLASVGTLAVSAFVVAALAALESLLSATVADGMSVNEQHDPDRELFGQGMANIVAPIFGGIPATAAIARTAVNVRAGARSRLAAVTHSVVLLIVVLALAPVVSNIPLAALAGVLFATCVRMVETGALRALITTSRSDALVVLVTFGVTVAIDLVTAVCIGVGVAVVLALRAMARSAHIDLVPLETGDYGEEERALLAEQIVAYRLDGPLFFAAAHRVLLDLSDIARVRVVILRMSRITTMDSTGAHVLGDAVRQLERRGITVMMSGIDPHHAGVLASLDISQHLVRDGLIFPGTPEAIAHARQLLAASREPAAPDIQTASRQQGHSPVTRQTRPPMSIAQVQRWVISALICSVTLFPLGALTAAIHDRADEDPSGAVMLTVMMGVIGVAAAVAVRLVHRRSPWSPWLALGTVAAFASAIWTWGL